MQYPKTNSEFLSSLFGEIWKEIPVSSGAGWGVMPAGNSVDLFMPTQPNYYCVSVFNCGTGRFRRKKEIFRKQLIVVVDDIGTKLSLNAAEVLFPPPTYKLETSPGNWQWGYVITGGCDDARVVEAIIDAIIENDIVNPSLKDPGMKNVTRVVRLPFGANTKEKVIEANGGKPFLGRLTEWTPGLSYPVETLAAAFGADISEDALACRKDTIINGAATQAEINGDYILKLFRSRGMIVDESINESGFLAVECPWAEEHSDPRREAGYRPGLGGFQCFHGHCQDRTIGDVREWADKEMTKEELTEAALQSFAGLTEEDQALIEAEAEQSEAEAEEQKEKIKSVYNRYVYIKGLEKFVDLEKRKFHSHRDFNSFALELAPAGKTGEKSATAIFLNSGGRIVDDVDYLPGQLPLTVTEKEGITLSVYNLWRPGGITPAKTVLDAEVKDWTDHAAYIIPEGWTRDVFLDYIAFLIQRRGEKVNWAPVLRGAQGVGKDLMMNPIFAILGDWNVKTIKAKDLEGDWTDFLETEVVVVEELPPYGKKDLYENMKSLICVSQNYVRVNKKNLPQYYIRNKQNYFFFTNHIDALSLEEDDRRVFVIGSPAVRKDDAYYARLAKLFKDPTFIAKLYCWFKQRDISHFNPMAAPPMTEAKREMIDAARNPVDAWVEDQFQEGGAFYGRKFITMDEVMKESKKGGAFGSVPLSVSSRITPKVIGMKMRKLGLFQLNRIRSTSGGTNGQLLRLWTSLSPTFIEQMSVQLILETYNAEISRNATEATKDVG